MNIDSTTVNLGELIESIATAVVNAQTGLDRSSFLMSEWMSGHYPLRDRTTGQLVNAEGNATNTPVMVDSRVQFGFNIDKDGQRVPNMLSMMELGFTPTFYQFVDTVIEVRLALRIEKTEQRVDPATGKLVDGAGQTNAFRLVTQPLDAGYTSSYNYKAEFSSVFKTKIVCVPPPAALEERIRLVMQQEAQAN